ncbi:hypothetical protein [Lachnobacterium bovis]|uniref:hypothetical protein n=1 Tax=Lachnobacterium bovis TaxID=140626 RepID=UPI0004833431|nr:hypothetical protein [Lachnobacterium bovis]
MAKIDNVYAYYISSTSNKKSSKYDYHSKNDLKKVYTKIIQVNKDSPLFKLAEPSTAKRFAIDIKETSRSLLHVVASLSDEDSLESCFDKKVAYSSNPDVADATFWGNSSYNENDTFTLHIDSLAKPQVNTGNFLKADILSFIPGNYTFDLKTQSSTYEFQFNIKSTDTNFMIQNKLVNLINSSNVGLKASLISDDDNANAIRLIGNNTGLVENNKQPFSVFPSSKNNSIAMMDVLGITNISHPACNSSFTIDGEPYSSTSNSFILNNDIELLLLAEGDDATTKIGFKNNVEAISENVTNLTTAYNNMLTLAQNYATIHEKQNNRNQFFLSMASISVGMKSQLDSIGLEVSENGYVFVNDLLLEDAVSTKNLDETFETLNSFKNSIGSKADDISINPLAYMDKIIYEYKPPYNNFPTPYVPSVYVGLFLDNYV